MQIEDFKIKSKMINVEACLDLFDLTLKKRLLLYVFFLIFILIC